MGKTAAKPSTDTVDLHVTHPDRLIGRLMKQVLASIVRGIDARMQPLELTAMQWEPLLIIAKGVDTVAALARESNVDCGSMTRMLDRLETKELLRRRRSETDRRVVHLELTGKGREVIQKIVPLVHEELNIHLHDFTADERATLTALLSRMALNGSSALSAGAAPLGKSK